MNWLRAVNNNNDDKYDPENCKTNDFILSLHTTLDKKVEQNFYEEALKYKPLNYYTTIKNDADRNQKLAEMVQKLKFFYSANRDIPVNPEFLTNVAKVIWSKNIDLMDTTKVKTRNQVLKQINDELVPA